MHTYVNVYSVDSLSPSCNSSQVKMQQTGIGINQTMTGYVHVPMCICADWRTAREREREEKKRNNKQSVARGQNRTRLGSNDSSVHRPTPLRCVVILLGTYSRLMCFVLCMYIQQQRRSRAELLALGTSECASMQMQICYSPAEWPLVCVSECELHILLNSHFNL